MRQSFWRISLPSGGTRAFSLKMTGIHPPPTLRKRPPEGQKEPKTISRARVLPIPGAVPAVFPASPSSRARVVLARVLPVPGALPAVLPASPSSPSPCCTRPCSPARLPARPHACSLARLCFARPPSLSPARQPGLPARPLYRCAPARLHQPVSPVPCPARPPPVLACPPACLRSTCLRARPHTNVACPPLDRPTARRRRPALLPAARLPVRPPACLPPACSPAHPPACLPSVYEPHANADATRATLRPRWLHTPAPHPRPFPPCTAAPHHRRTAAYVRRGGRCVLWP